MKQGMAMPQREVSEDRAQTNAEVAGYKYKQLGDYRNEPRDPPRLGS